jgi:hypothetical protein
MPNDYPAGFVPDEQEKVPEGFVPDSAPKGPQLSPEQQAAQKLTGGAISPQGLQPQPSLKPTMEAAGARHMQNEARLGQYQDFAAHSPTPVSNASLLYPAAEFPSVLRRGSELISKPFSRLSLANEWKVPGTPINVRLKAPPLTDRLGSEINMPGIESEMQTDIAKGRLQRAAARDSMYKELGQARAALPPATPELGSPENPGFYAKLPTRMPRPELPAAPVPELGSPENPGFYAKLPTRMPKLNQAPPVATLERTLGRGLATNSPYLRAFSPPMDTPPADAMVPVRPNVRFVDQFEKPRIAAPDSPPPVRPEGEGPIGSNLIERRIQATASKEIVTPEEYAQSVRDLGSRARMLPGEGEAEWRARVTGLLKAARGRTQ